MIDVGQIYSFVVNLIIGLSIVIGWMCVVRGMALALEEAFRFGVELLTVGYVLSTYYARRPPTEDAIPRARVHGIWFNTVPSRDLDVDKR